MLVYQRVSVQNGLSFNLSCPLNFNQNHLNFQVKQDFDGNCVPVDFRMGFLNGGSQVTIGFNTKSWSSNERDDLGVAL